MYEMNCKFSCKFFLRASGFIHVNHTELETMPGEQINTLLLNTVELIEYTIQRL